MSPVPTKHVLEQGPMIRSLVRTALGLVSQKNGAAPTCPGPWILGSAAAPSADLVRAFVKDGGGDPASYRKHVPCTLFPQWGLPIVARVVRGLPYPIARVLNAGVRLESRAPVPIGEPLVVRSRLESILSDESHARITVRVVTGTKGDPEALVADARLFVPLAKSTRTKKPGSFVPQGAREIAWQRVGAGAGLDFAKLTGDFNPIHWIPAYARAAGFKTCILQGYGTVARAGLAIERRVASGAPLSLLDVRLARPLVLPAKVGVYVDATNVWVASGPGTAPYLTGTFATRIGGEA